MIWAGASFVAALLLIAPGLPDLAKRICRVYGFYFSIAFVLRGALLAWLEPDPIQGSSFALSSLAHAGYSRGLGEVMPFAMASAFGFFVALLATSRFLRPGQLRFGLTTSTSAMVFGIGVAARVAGLLFADDATLARMGGVGQAICAAVLAGTVLGTDWRRTGVRLVVAMGFAEVLLSILSASKTPVLTLLLLLYLDPHRGRVTIRAFLLGVGVVVGAFTFLQRLKPNANQIEGENILAQAFFSIIGRLDGLYALAGAWQLGAGQYNPSGGMAGAALRAVTPGWLQSSTKELAGGLWGINVYGVHNGVSYAEGLAGEGLAIGGVWGPLIWGLCAGVILASALLLASSGNLGFQLAGLAFVASTVVYERGLLGQIEQIGSVVQAALATSVCLLVLGAARANRPVESRLEPHFRSGGKKKQSV